MADLPGRVAPQRVAERVGRVAIGEHDEPGGQEAEIGESRHLSVLLRTKMEQLLPRYRSCYWLHLKYSRPAPPDGLVCRCHFGLTGARRPAPDPPTTQSRPNWLVFDRGPPGRAWIVGSRVTRSERLVPERKVPRSRPTEAGDLLERTGLDQRRTLIGLHRCT